VPDIRSAGPGRLGRHGFFRPGLRIFAQPAAHGTVRRRGCPPWKGKQHCYIALGEWMTITSHWPLTERKKTVVAPHRSPGSCQTAFHAAVRDCIRGHGGPTAVPNGRHRSGATTVDARDCARWRQIGAPIQGSAGFRPGGSSSGGNPKQELFYRPSVDLPLSTSRDGQIIVSPAQQHRPVQGRNKIFHDVECGGGIGGIFQRAQMAERKERWISAIMCPWTCKLSKKEEKSLLAYTGPKQAGIGQLGDHRASGLGGGEGRFGHSSMGA